MSHVRIDIVVLKNAMNSMKALHQSSHEESRSLKIACELNSGPVLDLELRYMVALPLESSDGVILVGHGTTIVCRLQIPGLSHMR